MSLSSVDHVYLASRPRRPSFDQFLETALQTPVFKQTSIEDPPAPVFEAEMPAGLLKDHLDSLGGAAEPEISDDDGDHLENVIKVVKKTFTRSMNEIEDTGDEDSDLDPDPAEEDNFTNHDPTPEPQSPARMVARTRSRSRAAESPAESSHDEVEKPQHNLRQRTVSQNFPFLHDKKKHALKAKQGKDVKSSEIDAEVLKSTQQPKVRKSTSPPKTKKRAAPARRSGRTSKARKTSTESTLTVDDRSMSNTPASLDNFSPEVKVEYTPEERIEQTTLWSYLKDEQDKASAPIPLEECQTLGLLIDSVKESWGYRGGEFESIQCMLPWKKENNKILIREGMTHSFTRMMKEIQNAPAWKKGPEELEVKLIVKFV